MENIFYTRVREGGNLNTPNVHDVINESPLMCSDRLIPRKRDIHCFQTVLEGIFFSSVWYVVGTAGRGDRQKVPHPVNRGGSLFQSSEVSDPGCIW